MKKSLSFLLSVTFILGMSSFMLNCSPNKMKGVKALSDDETAALDLTCDDNGTCTKKVKNCNSDGEDCNVVIESCDTNGENCTEIQTCDANGENCVEIEGELDCSDDSSSCNEVEEENPVEEIGLNLGSCKFLDKDRASAVLVSPNKDSSIIFNKSENPGVQEKRAFEGLEYLANKSKAIDVASYTLDSEGKTKCTALSESSCSFDFIIYTSSTNKDCQEFKEDGVTCKEYLPSKAINAGLTQNKNDAGEKGGWIPRNLVATIDKGAEEDGSACTLSVKYLGSSARTDAGCFDPETKIKSIDNKEIPIRLLTQADKVFNPITQKFMEVKRIVKGPELLPLVEVTVKDKVIKVSSTHAMITKQGVKIAMDLSLNDEIALEDGKTFNKIESIKLLPVDKKQQVINLELKTNSKKPEDHAVLANGMVSGDLFLQAQKEKELKLDKKADKKLDKKAAKEEKVEKKAEAKK